MRANSTPFYFIFKTFLIPLVSYGGENASPHYKLLPQGTLSILDTQYGDINQVKPLLSNGLNLESCNSLTVSERQNLIEVTYWQKTACTGQPHIIYKSTIITMQVIMGYKCAQMVFKIHQALVNIERGKFHDLKLFKPFPAP